MSERRRNPRVELLAHAQVSSMGEVYLLRVRNASRAGLFVEGPPARHPELQIDAAVDVMLTALDVPESPPVGFSARVVRIDHDPEQPGFGLEIEVIDEANTQILETLLGDEVAED